MTNLYANATVANNGCISPANAHGASNGVWTGNDGNSEKWDARWGMENPPAGLEGTQTINVLVRKNSAGGNGDPTILVDLYENGSFVATLQGTTAISSTTGVTVGGTFDASVLSDVSGAGVQIYLDGDGTGGMPTGRRAVQVDSIEWVASLAVLPPDAPTLLFPADGANVGLGTQEHTWSYNETDVNDDGQSHFAFRRTLGVEDEWWDGAGWVGTETFIASVTESVTVSWDDEDTTYTWTVRTRGTGGDGPYTDPPFTINVAPAPDAPTLVDPPEGAVHDPVSFEWTHNSFTGDDQTAFALRKADEALFVPEDVVWDPALGNINDVHFSPDGTMLAIAHGELPHITVYDTSDWSVIPGTPSVAAFTGMVVRFSPDNSMLAVGFSGNDIRFMVYDTSDWSEVSGVPSSSEAIRAIAWSPDGSMLARGHSNFPRLSIYHTDTWNTVVDQPGLGVDVRGLDFSPDGSKLAVGGNSSIQALFIYDVLNEWNRLNGEVEDRVVTGIAEGIRFSPDSSLLAVGSTITPYLFVFDVNDWSTAIPGVPAVPDASWAKDCVFTPDGSLLGVAHDGGKHLTVYDTSDWSIVEGVPENVGSTSGNAIHVSFDGLYFAVGYTNGDRLLVLNLQPQMGYTWWSGTEWVTTETFITSIDETVSLPSGAWFS